MNKAKTLLYFGYGSNMSTRYLVKRRKIIPLESQAALVKGYELIMNIEGPNFLEPSFANIRPYKRSSVEGVVHKIDEQDLQKIRVMYKCSGRVIFVIPKGFFLMFFTTAGNEKVSLPLSQQLYFSGSISKVIVCHTDYCHMSNAKYVDPRVMLLLVYAVKSLFIGENGNGFLTSPSAYLVSVPIIELVPS